MAEGHFLQLIYIGLMVLRSGQSAQHTTLPILAPIRSHELPKVISQLVSVAPFMAAPFVHKVRDHLVLWPTDKCEQEGFVIQNPR